MGEQEIVNEVICKGQLFKLMAELSERYTPEVAWAAFDSVRSEHEDYIEEKGT